MDTKIVLQKINEYFSVKYPYILLLYKSFKAQNYSQHITKVYFKIVGGDDDHV